MPKSPENSPSILQNATRLAVIGTTLLFSPYKIANAQSNSPNNPNPTEPAVTRDMPDYKGYQHWLGWAEIGKIPKYGTPDWKFYVMDLYNVREVKAGGTIKYQIPSITFERNPSVLERITLYRMIADNWEIPHEVFLAIGYQESRLQQWQKNGKAILSYTGNGRVSGMGAFQIEKNYHCPPCDAKLAQESLTYNGYLAAEHLAQLAENLKVTDRGNPEAWKAVVAAYNPGNPYYTGIVYDHIKYPPVVNGQSLW